MLRSGSWLFIRPGRICGRVEDWKRMLRCALRCDRSRWKVMADARRIKHRRLVDVGVPMSLPAISEDIQAFGVEPTLCLGVAS
jgi:hypothetical protein